MKKIGLILISGFLMIFAKESSELSWWKQFNDPSMNKILSEGLKENRTLMASAARIDQSEQYAKIIRSQMLPSLSGNFVAGRRKIENTFPYFGSVAATISATLDVRYKLDSWGEELQQYRAAKLLGKATEADHKKTVLKISVTIGSLYFDAIFAKSQIEILKVQKKNAEDLLRLAKLRYEQGISSGFVLLQQKQQLASVEATIPPSVMMYKNTLEYLSAVTFIPTDELEKLIPNNMPEISDFSTGVISTIGSYDILSAKLKEAAAKASFTKTKLTIVPTINLSGSIGYNFSNPIAFGTTEDWTDSWVLGAAITLPLYTGGAILSGLKESRASYRVATATRAQIEKDAERILNSAVNTEKGYNDQLKAYKNQLKASEDLYNESLNQYKLGLISYSDVLNSLNSYQQSQITTLSSRKNLLNSRLQIIEAVGGK